MAFDFKKEYSVFYLPKERPQLVTVPPMRYLAVRGSGDPNEEGGAYKASIGVLYTLAYTIKMSKMGDHRMDGYFDFVVPPLEGFWWQDGVEGVDFSDKSRFRWISVIRVPDFVTERELQWAIEQAKQKKNMDCSSAELLQIEEGECVQLLHIGAYDDEPTSIARMDAFLAENGYENDFSATRRHHEIYLSDARKVPPERRKTVIRHPVRKSEK